MLMIKPWGSRGALGTLWKRSEPAAGPNWEVGTEQPPGENRLCTSALLGTMAAVSMWGVRIRSPTNILGQVFIWDYASLTGSLVLHHTYRGSSQLLGDIMGDRGG